MQKEQKAEAERAEAALSQRAAQLADQKAHLESVLAAHAEAERNQEVRAKKRGAEGGRRTSFRGCRGGAEARADFRGEGGGGGGAASEAFKGGGARVSAGWC